MAENLQTLDFSILDWIQSHIRSDALDWLMPKITMLGDKGIFFILLALICLTVPKWRKCGITMGSALLIGLLVGNVIIKLLAARDRPCWIAPPEVMLIPVPRDTSFPSCHSLSGFAVAVSLLFYHRLSGIMGTVLAVLIAFSRLYLYVHFPTDVLAGTLLGIGIAVGCYFLTEHYTASFLTQKFPKFLPA